MKRICLSIAAITMIFGTAFAKKHKAPTSWTQYGKTVAGNGVQGSSLKQLDEPFQVYVDKHKNVYVADNGNNRIVRWGADEKIGVIVAGFVDTPESPKFLSAPHGVFMDKDGSLYATDFYNNTVRKWEKGKQTDVVVAGDNTSGSTMNQLSDPRFISVDKDKNIYIADLGNKRILKWPNGGTTAEKIAEPVEVNTTRERHSVFIDDKMNVYVSDKNTGEITKWPSDGSKGTVIGKVAGAMGIFVDEWDDVYVPSSFGDSITMFAPGDANGKKIVGGHGRGNAGNQFNMPVSVFVDEDGDLYVTDHYNHRVQKFTAK